MTPFNEQKNQRYGFSSATKQPLNIFFLALSSIANDSQLFFLIDTCSFLGLVW
jgi:hypothetical protein